LVPCFSLKGCETNQEVLPQAPNIESNTMPAVSQLFAITEILVMNILYNLCEIISQSNNLWSPPEHIIFLQDVMLLQCGASPVFAPTIAITGYGMTGHLLGIVQYLTPLLAPCKVY